MSELRSMEPGRELSRLTANDEWLLVGAVIPPNEEAPERLSAGCVECVKALRYCHLVGRTPKQMFCAFCERLGPLDPDNDVRALQAEIDRLKVEIEQLTEELESGAKAWEGQCANALDQIAERIGFEFDDSGNRADEIAEYVIDEFGRVCDEANDLRQANASHQTASKHYYEKLQTALAEGRALAEKLAEAERLAEKMRGRE